VPNQTEVLLAALLVLTVGCETAPADDPPDQAPDPIGDELIRWDLGEVGLFGGPSTCATAFFYREGRQVQQLCFFSDGLFSYENRGTLTPGASAALDVELAAADFDDRTPVNYMGFCGNPDARATVTMWADDQSIEFRYACLFEGIVPLYEAIYAIQTELWYCGEDSPPDKLESIEPGCRWI
jgi:hypothetical protein